VPLLVLFGLYPLIFIFHVSVVIPAFSWIISEIIPSVFAGCRSPLSLDSLLELIVSCQLFFKCTFVDLLLLNVTNARPTEVVLEQLSIECCRHENKLEFEIAEAARDLLLIRSGIQYPTQ